ncbi:ubiquitin/ISG15-conjugating enzyme E2 L6 isoform X1 [Meriones unguiculatus]|uniref:ubiquitin/ISG15-conjugating enzyme E2 L6 isoform X1 n=2 Tax=Meriones unguiculatus TaxID=10047 RepID=UPI00293F086E|nr:ubiquitin/ISG15-conjugating enzyme E2 L6 isoform X1 [Meriones unguiculatus]
MTASKRVAKELEELSKQLPPYLRHLSSDDANVLEWRTLLLPDLSTQVLNLSHSTQVLNLSHSTQVLNRSHSTQIRKLRFRGEMWLTHGNRAKPRVRLSCRAGQCSCDQLPYGLKAFRLQIDFPREYPLKPPTLKFITKIYHPNVGEDGLVCLPLISRENWKPYTKAYQVLEALNVLVSRPNLDEPVRLELADLLTQNPEQFWKKAEEFTLQFGVDRPSCGSEASLPGSSA